VLNITLEVTGDKEKYECILRLESLHPIKDNNILEQPRDDFNESWFQSIIGKPMQSNPRHTWFSFSLVCVESAPDSLVKVSICSTALNFIPNISWILEWINWKSTYT
jgi:hypothetical protein